MVRVYLAASRARKLEMLEVRDWIHGNGLGVVTSRWIDRPGEFDVSFDLLQSDPHRCSRFAIEDIEDIKASNCFIMFTGDNKSSGGRHTQFGMALTRKEIVALYIIGPRENVFQCLCSQFDVYHFSSWSEFTESFKKAKEEMEFAKITHNLIIESLFRDTDK